MKEAKPERLPERFAPRWWYILLTAFISAAMFGALAFALAVRVGQENLRTVCAVVAASDDAYRETPPTTPAGRNVAEATADLRRQLDCR